ncbi:MAG: hypothetical protein V4726_04875 [Verrucomicrobiota bacterium]
MVVTAVPAAGLLLPALPEACGSTAFFPGKEYQANSPSSSVTGGGDAAADPAFADWPATAGLTLPDVTSATGDSPKAVWGILDSAAENVTSYACGIGGARRSPPPFPAGTEPPGSRRSDGVRRRGHFGQTTEE